MKICHFLLSPLTCISVGFGVIGSIRLGCYIIDYNTMCKPDKNQIELIPYIVALPITIGSIYLAHTNKDCSCLLLQAVVPIAFIIHVNKKRCK
jgi:hypothetical protein